MLCDIEYVDRWTCEYIALVNRNEMGGIFSGRLKIVYDLMLAGF